MRGTAAGSISKVKNFDLNAVAGLTEKAVDFTGINSEDSERGVQPNLGMADRIGSIAPGLDADIIATAGNPIEDINAVRHVVFVMKGGKLYKNTLSPQHP